MGFCYGQPQNGKPTHTNLYIQIAAADDNVLWASYNENKTMHENTLSRPDNENLTQRKFPARIMKYARRGIDRR